MSCVLLPAGCAMVAGWPGACSAGASEGPRRSGVAEGQGGLAAAAAAGSARPDRALLPHRVRQKCAGGVQGEQGARASEAEGRCERELETGQVWRACCCLKDDLEELSLRGAEGAAPVMAEAAARHRPPLCRRCARQRCSRPRESTCRSLVVGCLACVAPGNSVSWHAVHDSSVGWSLHVHWLEQAQGCGSGELSLEPPQRPRLLTVHPSSRSRPLATQLLTHRRGGRVQAGFW